MATAAVRNALRVPGRLVKDPTDLDEAFPYGGTALGLVKSMRFKPIGPQREIWAEEFASVVEIVQAGYGGKFSGVLREFDDDAISAMFPDTTAGSVSSRRVIHGRPLTTAPGARLSTRAHALLFVPNAAVRHPAVYIPHAIPVVAQEVELGFAANVEIGMSVLWHAMPDDDDPSYVIGRLADITL